MSAWLSRLFRCLLRLYPRAFRERYGEELLATLADAWRDRRRGGTGMALCLILDLLASAMRQRVEAGLHARPPRRPLWLGALALALAGLAARDPLASAAVHGFERNRQTAVADARRARAESLAVRASGVAQFGTTAAQAKAGMLWALAAQDNAAPMAARSNWADLAAASLRRALARPDATPTQLWVVASACALMERKDCPRGAALRTLAGIQPDNAAVWHAQLEDALPANADFAFLPMPQTAVTPAVRAALAHMSGARYYRTEVHARLGDLVGAAGPAARADLDDWRLPFAYGQFWAGLDRLCRTTRDPLLQRDCRGAAARLADADAPVAQAAGAKLAYALSSSTAGRAHWREAYRRALWIDQALGATDDASAWRAAASEVDATSLQLRARGLPTTPPPGWAESAMAATLAP
jgi:hypothetical protein